MSESKEQIEEKIQVEPIEEPIKKVRKPRVKKVPVEPVEGEPAEPIKKTRAPRVKKTPVEPVEGKSTEPIEKIVPTKHTGKLVRGSIESKEHMAYVRLGHKLDI